MNIQTKVGDVFLVPLDAGSFGIGVVAAKWRKELYLVLFSRRIDDMALAVSLSIHELTPIIASSSLDAKLWHGHWPIVRSGVDTSFIAQPFYKVEEPSGLVGESFDRKHRRPVSAPEAANLTYRKTVAPVRLENALKAFHKLTEWDPIFNELLYSNVVQSSGLSI